MLQYSNPEFIEMIIKEFQFQDTSLFDYLKEYKIKMSSHVAKQFFSKLAQKCLSLMIPPLQSLLPKCRSQFCRLSIDPYPRER